MVLKLSKVLRRLLRKHENFSALRDELSFIDDYLSIEVVRFGDKLRFEKEVVRHAGHAGAEHAAAAAGRELRQARLEQQGGRGHDPARKPAAGRRLPVEVEDDGVGIPESKLATLLDHGIGVSNVNERLKVLFGSDHKMKIDSQPGRGTRIQIEIPELQTSLVGAS